MTIWSGYVTTLVQLGTARVGLGISEAAVAPAAHSMLSDLLPRQGRTAPLALLAVAGPLGAMLAFTMGGIANAALGWRMTFVVLGAPGLLLCVVVLRIMREPRRGAPVLNLGASFFGTAMLGPLRAVTQMLALVRMRAQAAAFVALVFNLVGAGLGPLAVGVLSDWLAGIFGPSSIRYALLAASVIALPGAALSFHRGAGHVASELERAHA